MHVQLASAAVLPRASGYPLRYKNLNGMAEGMVFICSPAVNNMHHSRIYIAEEDKVLQRRLYSALEKHGFDVQVFDNGYPLIELVDNWPDVFLIDIQLSGINGLEVCEWLKSHDGSGHIPVILISGESYLKTLAAATHADDYIEKPIVIPQLLGKIKECLLEKPKSSSGGRQKSFTSV